MKPLSSDPSMRAPVVTSGAQAEGARPVRFDRPLVEIPGWGDPRLARQVAEATRAGREKGLAEGYAEGWAQGRKAAAAAARREAAERVEHEEAARRQVATRVQSLLATLAQTARTLTEQAVPAWQDLTDVLVDGALAIAGSGLDRELAAIDAETLEAVRTALRVLPAAESVTVHIHPDDVELLGLGATGATAAGPALPDGLLVVPDPAVAPGTVLALTALHTLPVDLKAGLRAAQEVLRS